MATNHSFPRNGSNRELDFIKLAKIRRTRGYELYNAGVIPVLDSTNVFWIPSQSQKGKRYRVNTDGNKWDCTCPDFLFNHVWCKHVCLAQTWQRMKNQTQEEILTQEGINPCPICNGLKIIRNGTRKTVLGLKQRWLCQSCGKRFVAEPINRIKGNTEIVSLTCDLYFKGCSYRSIADTIKQFYGLEIAHVTVMRWVQTVMSRINRYVEQLHPQVSDRWHADEQMVNVKGKWQYIWNCLDSKTRFLLANEVTPSRTYEDARALFQQAKATADSKAKTVVTDGAFSYGKAVRKEFATYQNPHPHERYVTLKDESGANNLIERYHGSFRQRDKSMRAFKQSESTQKYASGYKTYYNFVRPHQALQGKTPAQAGGIGINTNNKWKELLEKSREVKNV